MARAQANGIEIEWEARGPADAPAILLIMGLGAQLTLWPDALLDGLVAQGFRAIRYDNRDVGLSTKVESGGVPNLMQLGMAMMTGAKPEVPYTLGDMAADAVGLLDALGIAKAHIVGASMGGMIAQLVAVTYPDRVLSLTSIMSTTSNPALPRASAEANAVLMSRPAGGDVEALVAFGVKAAQTVGSPVHRTDPAVLAERVRRDLTRSYYPQGFARQLGAIVADGDRRGRLATVTAPTLVIHGDADPLVPIAGGRDTAASIPAARLVELAGMGHDLPEPLLPQVVALIAGHALAAAGPAFA
ncbi:alpha/beta fold hydrolase [Sphingomonas sp.]|uniref:alpha/beta fold hydrolase n=1 Tax=Sphingomonas sp. TaxID=28214 RepID=UPI003CC59677